MNDIFNEHLVKREPRAKDMVIKVLTCIVAFVIAFISLFSPIQIFPFVFAIEIFLIVIFFRRMNVEFEYVLTNHELDINKIYNKSSRKKIMTVNVKDFIAMVQAQDKYRASEVAKYDKKLDFTSGVVKENTYIIIFKEKEKRIQMSLELSEKMLKSIKMLIPQIVRK